MAYRKTGRYSVSSVPVSGWGETNIVARNTGGSLTSEESQVPKYDTGRIAGLVQEQMEPGLGLLRRGMQAARSRRYSTPTARSAAMRGVYRGAGEAMPAIQAGAQRTARGLYQPEYERELMEWRRLQRENEMEEERAMRMGRRDPNSTTYREATANLLAYDPFGEKARFAERPFSPDPTMPTRLTGGTGGGGLLEEWEGGGSRGLGEITYTPAERVEEPWLATVGR